MGAYLGLELLTLLRILQRRGRFKLLQHHTDWYRRESCQYDEPVRRTRTKGTYSAPRPRWTGWWRTARRDRCAASSCASTLYTTEVRRVWREATPRQWRTFLIGARALRRRLSTRDARDVAAARALRQRGRGLAAREGRRTRYGLTERFVARCKQIERRGRIVVELGRQVPRVIWILRHAASRRGC